MADDNSLRYVRLDYQSLKEALLNRVRARWPLVWNDFLSNSFGTVLTDLIAWATSTLAYTINRVAAENFLSTMTLRESALRLGNMVGYQLKNPGAASVLCEVQLLAAAQSNVTLKKGTTITASGANSSGLPFELSKDYVIPAGSTYPEQLVAIISPNRSGGTVILSTVTATNGSQIFDVADSTIDISQYVDQGQVLRQLGSTTTYVIQSIEAAPGASQPNRLICDPAWTGTTGSIEVEILERRAEFIQGQTFTEVFTTPAAQTPGITYTITRVPVIDNSVKVQVNSDFWTTGTTLALASSTDTSVAVQITVDGNTVLTFGDGVFGAMPPANASVTVTYRTGGGTTGNVELGAISASALGTDANGVPVTVSVKNLTASGQGGTDAETLDEARLTIPRYIKTNDRAVTLSDYETIAAQYTDATYGQVRYARAMSRAEGNLVIVYAWTTGSAGGLVELSSGLKKALQTYLQSKSVGTDSVLIADGTAKPFPASTRFKVLPGFSISDVQSLYDTALTNYVNAGTPGGTLVFSNLVKTLSAVTGVDSVSIATPIENLTPDDATQLFVPADDTYKYVLNLIPQSTLTYTTQTGIIPLQAWAFRAYLGGYELSVLSDIKAGRARLVGPGLASFDVGYLSERPVASSSNSGSFYQIGTQIYKSDGVNWNTVSDGGSYVNLLTGAVYLSTTGSPGDFSISLITATGYDAERSIDLYIGYSGDNTEAKRAEIRTALRVWSDGLKVGDTIFASSVKNTSGVVVLDSSRSNITDVIRTISGVTSVNQVSMVSPSNSDNRIDASAGELLRVGTITLNGLLN